MPFQSDAQRKFLYANHPSIAKRWAKEYGSKVIRKKAVRKLKINAKLPQLKN